MHILNDIPECLKSFLDKELHVIDDFDLQSSLSDQGYLLREILLWLIYATRPLTLSELQDILQFSVGLEDDLTLRVEIPPSLRNFLVEDLSEVVDLQVFPATVASLNHDGKHDWSIKRCEHPVLKGSGIVSWLDALPTSHPLYFPPRERQIVLAELCMKYLMSIPGELDMNEAERIEACAEYPFLQYALSSFAAHAACAPLSVLETFINSQVFCSKRPDDYLGILLPDAAKRDDHHMLGVLLQRVDPNYRMKGSQSYNALMYAAITGNLETTRLLLSHPHIQVDNQAFLGMTALHLACQHENFEVARLIMSMGHANVLLCDSRGWNVLRHLFRTCGFKATDDGRSHHEELVETIDQIVISAFSTGSIKVSSVDLEAARQNGNHQALEYLLVRHKPLITHHRNKQSLETCTEKNVYEASFSDAEPMRVSCVSKCCTVM